MEDHFLREVLSQPDVWRRTLALMFGKDSPLKGIDKLIGDGPVLFTGCGSSYCLSLAAAPMWTRFVGGPARALSASDVMMYPESYLPRGVKGTVVGISRSGTTEETREAMRLLRKSFGWRTIGVTCHAGTGILDECEGSLVLAEAAETARFTTRALTTTMLAMEILAAVKARDRKLGQELRRLPDLTDGLLARHGPFIKDMAGKGDFDQYVYLGQGPYFGFAMESMLKTKEMALTAAEAYPSLEYMHGAKYAAGAKTLITMLLSDGGKMPQLEMLAKLKELGARTAVVCERATPEVAAGADFVMELNSGLSDYGRMLLVMPLMQLFVYHRACALGRSAWIKRMVYH